MILAYPEMLVLLLVALPLLVGLRHRAHVHLPRLWQSRRKGGLLRAAWQALSGAFSQPLTTTLRVLPLIVLFAAVLSISLALCKPQRITNIPHTTTVQGREFICALDYSGSMGLPFKGEVPRSTLVNPFYVEEPKQDDDVSVGPKQLRRIDAAQAFILSFVEMRLTAGAADRVGLIAFDDRPRLCWPLDRDLRQIVRHGNFVPGGDNGNGLGNGTNFGTTPPGPIDLAAEHFDKRGQSKSRVLILVSDGDNELNAQVQSRLINVIRNAGMRFYVIGVGEVIASKDVDILKVARAVGGVCFRVERSEDMQRCFEEIDRLESSPIPQESTLMHEELFYIPLTIGLGLFLSWLALEGILKGR